MRILDIKLTESEKLCLARRREGLTQKQRAEQLGVTQTAVSAWETGKRTPPVWVVRRIHLEPSLGELCFVGRRRVPLSVHEASALVGVSRVTLLKWERSVPSDRYVRVLERCLESAGGV